MFDGSSLIVEDVPTTTFKSGKKNKTVIVIPALADLFNVLFSGADHAFIEQVGAMPGQGVTSMFTFGKAAGCLEMGVAMCQVPYTMVTPAKWKMALGLNDKAEKSILRANQLFPKYTSLFARKMDHNRAEAALIAWYGYRMLTEGKVVQPS